MGNMNDAPSTEGTSIADTYRRPAAETFTDPEVDLVRCHLVVRGVEFGIHVTDRRVGYVRARPFRAAEWVYGPAAEVRDVSLSARNPWPHRVGAAACAAVVAWLLGAFATGEVNRLNLRGTAILAGFAALLLVSARGRLVLEWRDGAGRHRVAQPSAYERIEREGMAGALTEAARLLSDVTARRSAADRERARRGLTSAG